MNINKLGSVLEHLGRASGMLEIPTNDIQLAETLANARGVLADLRHELLEELPDVDTAEVRGAFDMLELMGYKQRGEVVADAGDDAGE